MKPVNYKERRSALGKFISVYTITTLLSIAVVAFIFSSFKVVEGEASASQREVNELGSVLDDKKNSIVDINTAIDDGADLNDLFSELGQIRNMISRKNVYNSSNESLRSIARDVEAILINYRSLLNRYMSYKSRLDAVQSENPCEDIERRLNDTHETMGLLQSRYDNLLNQCSSSQGGSDIKEKIPDAFVNDFLKVIEDMAEENNERIRKQIGVRAINAVQNAGYFRDFSESARIQSVTQKLR